MRNDEKPPLGKSDKKGVGTITHTYLTMYTDIYKVIFVTNGRDKSHAWRCLARGRESQPYSEASLYGCRKSNTRPVRAASLRTHPPADDRAPA
jgi:hypothetical protein